MVSFARRVMWVGVALAVAGLGTGCNMSSDIPVVQFPEGSRPTPPPVVKADPKAKGQSKTSKGDPSLDYR